MKKKYIPDRARRGDTGTIRVKSGHGQSLFINHHLSMSLLKPGLLVNHGFQGFFFALLEENWERGEAVARQLKAADCATFPLQPH